MSNRTREQMLKEVFMSGKRRLRDQEWSRDKRKRGRNFCVRSKNYFRRYRICKGILTKREDLTSREMNKLESKSSIKQTMIELIMSQKWKEKELILKELLMDLRSKMQKP